MAEISALATINSIYSAIQDAIKTAKTVQKEFIFLTARFDAVLEPLKVFEKDPQRLRGKEKALSNIENLFGKILTLLRERRFQETTFIAKLEKCRYLYEDAAVLKEFHERLHYVAGDLGIVLQLSAAIDLQDIKDNGALCVHEILQVLGKQEMSAAEDPNFEAIKAELDKSIEASARLSHIVDLEAKASVLPASILPADIGTTSPEQPDSTEVPLPAPRIGPRIRNLMGLQLTPVNLTRLEFDENLSKRIGQGSFGDVFECYYKGQPAALKRLPRILSSVQDIKVLKSLEREALIMQFVDHPNVIGFLGACLTDVEQRGHMLIMELANGSLDDFLYNPRANELFGKISHMKSQSWKFDVLGNIACALRYLHANNIVHRDIKPANVLLVARDPTRAVAKLCDFGLSQALEIATSSVGSKASNIKAVGTSHYMPPEVLNPTEKIVYSSETDMFSFGVLAAELFVQQRPWTGTPLGTLTHAVVNKHERALIPQWNELLQRQGDVDEFKKLELKLFRLVGDANEGCLATLSSVRPLVTAFVQLLSPTLPLNSAGLLTTFDQFAIVPRPEVSTSTPPNVMQELEMNERTEVILNVLKNWLLRYCPDINREYLSLYARKLCVNKMTSFDRLKRVVTEKSKAAISFLTGDIGLNVLDAEDVLCSLLSPDTTIDNGDSETKTDLRPQGVQVLQDWLQMYVPDIPTTNLPSIASQLIGNNIVTVERFMKLVTSENFSFSFLQMHPLDWSDITACVNTKPAIPAPRSQGYDVLRQWLENSCPSISSGNISSLATQLVENNIVTKERCLKLLATENFDFSFLRVHLLDWNDVVSLVSTGGQVIQRDPLLAWMTSYLADTPIEILKVYVANLGRANIITVNRLLSVLAVTSNSELVYTSSSSLLHSRELVETNRKVFSNWDPLDIFDLQVASSLSNPPVVREHGKNALLTWMRQATPNIAVESCKRYAALIDDAGVKTVNRLKKVLDTNPQFLGTIGVNTLDAGDLIAELKHYEVEQFVSVAVPLYQGEEHLRMWLSLNVKELLKSSIEQYARHLMQCNIVTVGRLIRMTIQDSNWLIGILGSENELDVTDISNAALACTAWQPNELVLHAGKRGRIADINSAAMTARVEYFDGTVDLALILCPAITRVVISNGEALTNESIRSAVGEWRNARSSSFGPISSWNTSQVTDMSKLFENWSDFNENISEWDVSNVTNMEAMFFKASKFNQPVNAWVTSKVINMSKMFFGASSFKHCLDRWNVDSVRDMSSMFEGASSAFHSVWWNLSPDCLMERMFYQVLHSNITIRYAVHAWCLDKVQAASQFGPIDAWKVGSVTDMSSLFKDRSLFNDNINSWEVLSVTDMSSMFENATKFNQALNNWNVGNVKNMSRMFSDASAFNQPLNSWNVVNVQNMSRMFADARSFNQSLGNWNVSQVADFTFMFATAISFSQSISSWRVGDLSAIDNMFADVVISDDKTVPFSHTRLRAAVHLWCSDPEQARAVHGPIESWNTRNVTDMNSLFLDKSHFNDNIESWNVSKVTTMAQMFKGATMFNQPLDKWNVSQVQSMDSMFEGASSFNQPLSSWRPRECGYFSCTKMFAAAVSFAQPLNVLYFQSFNSSHLHRLSNMFLDITYDLGSAKCVFDNNTLKTAVNLWCSEREKAIIQYGHISTWNTTEVTIMDNLFQSKTAFNDDIHQWDVSNVSSMRFTFDNAASFNQPLEAWNVAKVANMSGMLQNAKAFNQPLNQWNVALVTDMSSLFQNATAFNQPLNQWTITSVAQMNCMFRNATAFNQPLSQWSVMSVTNMSGMFQSATSFNQPLNQWNVLKVTNMSGLFQSAATFNQPLDQWDVSSATNMSNMFSSAVAFNQPLNQWRVVNVTSMSSMFQAATNFNQPLGQWNVSNVTDMSCMFQNATTFNQPLDQWDVSSTTNMSNMFNSAVAFNQPLNQWNVRNVASMSAMFYGASSFNQPLNQWNVSNVTNMTAMFYSAYSFNQPLDPWNVSNVTNMSDMFRCATAFNQPLNQWNVSNVATMRGMFESTKFNQPLNQWNIQRLTLDLGTSKHIFDNGSLKIAVNLWCSERVKAMIQFGHISTWYTANVTSLDELFKDKKDFNDDIHQWNVSNVNSMIRTFNNAALFNQPLNLWNVSKVKNMTGLFQNAAAFNQPLNQWNVGNVTDMSDMFRSAASFNQPLDQWIVTCVTSMTGMFHSAVSFNHPLDQWNVSAVSNMELMFYDAKAFSQPLQSWDVRNATNVANMFNCNFESRRGDRWKYHARVDTSTLAWLRPQSCCCIA